ncbi:hypothetical protein K3727_05490 [Rhodobacteraceae bacterium M382]|nr:hypothetical protein K3727_05490 [Rhodobacteraceae bacterium M382]
MPNALAFTMLLIWPLIAVVLFRRLPLERAIIWTILGGYLILPPVAEFDLPLVPDMDKHTISAISAFVLCVFMMKKPVPMWSSSRGARVLIIVFLLSTIATVFTNTDPLLADVIENSYPIQIIMTHLPGLTWRDLGSVTINQFIVLLPFFLGRAYLSSDHGLRELLLALVVGALIYSVPALFEIRFSPQINIWVYGFFQHDFTQMIRGSGFRPIVFLQHGLWVAFFMTTAAMACAALARSVLDQDEKTRWLVALVWLFMTLILCKSLASQLYGLCFVPVILFLSPQWQLRLAVFLVLMGVAYPMLRNLGMVPMDAIIAQAQEFNPDRAESLAYRALNEEILMNRAHEKPWFGWGGWSRNLIVDIRSRESVTIPDGRWIIVFGTVGWVGYVAEMGLLALPVWLLWLRTDARTPPSPEVSAISLIVAVTMVDMLLNATLTTYTWMCVGAILGYVERLKSGVSKDRPSLFGDGPIMGGPRDPSRPRNLL